MKTMYLQGSWVMVVAFSKPPPRSEVCMYVAVARYAAVLVQSSPWYVRYLLMFVLPKTAYIPMSYSDVGY